MGAKSQLKEIAKVRTDNRPTAVNNLAKWLRECMYLADEEDSRARFARVVCHQLIKGNRRGEEVFHLDAPKKLGEDWPDSAAMEIYGKLQLEVATLGGLQKYALYAYHSGDNEMHSSRFVVKLQGTDDEEGDDLDSESPDKGGLVSQNMRHTEAMAKIVAAMIPTMVSGYQSMIQRQASMLDRQSGMIENLLKDKIDGIETMRQLGDEAEEREIRLVQARAKARGVENLVGKLGLLLPAAANKIAGKPIFPVQDASVMMMVKGLFTSLASNEERLKQMAAIMQPEESVAFMNILEEVSAKTDENGLPKKEIADKKQG